MRCPNCGHELANGSGFCENCGMILSLDNTGRESAQSKPTQRRKIKPNFNDDFIEYLDSGEEQEFPERKVKSEPYTFEQEPNDGEDVPGGDEEADYSQSQDEESREEDTVYAENEYYNLDRSHINSDDESSVVKNEKDSIEQAFSDIDDDADEDVDYADDYDDVRDMYVKRSKNKRGIAVVFALVIVLVAVVAVGVTIVRGNIKPAVAPESSSASPTSDNAVLPSTQTTDPKQETSEKQTLDELTTEETTEEKTTKENTTDEKTTGEKTTKEEITTKKAPSTTASQTSPTAAGTTAPHTTVPHTTAAPTAPSTQAPSESPEKYTIANLEPKKPAKYLASSYRTKITDDGCHMRSGPGTSYDHILYFSYGDSIKVLAKENGFLYVYSERYGVYGWVSSSLTAAKPDNKPTESTTTAPTRVLSPDKTYKNPETKKATAPEGLKLRFGPGTQYDALRLIAKDMSVVVKGYSTKVSGWVYVTVPAYGVSGWVSSAYLK